MAVTLVTTPDLYALTRGGRMQFQFTGSGRYETTGTKAVAVLRFAGAIADGMSLVLRWNGKSQRITARTTPGAPHEFLAGDGSSTYASEVLVPFFTSYFPFREAFVATASEFGNARGIVFTARQPGAASTLKFVSADRNPAAPATPVFDSYVVTPGVDALLRERYSAYVELYLQRAGTSGTAEADFDRIYQTSVEMDEDGLARFDAGDLLHAHLSADWPAWDFLNPSGSTTSHRRYFIAFGEAWGSPLRVGHVASDTIRHAYLGGADYTHRGGNGFELIQFAGTTPASDRALRLGSATRYVRMDEPQYLTFVNLRVATVASLSLKLVLTFDDNSTLTVASAYADQSRPEGEKITFPVGAGQLDLFSRVPAGRSLREYSAQLFVGANAYSLLYRYLLNYDYQPYTRYFAYLNSLGCIDTLTSFGKGSQELNRFFEQAQQYQPAHYDVKDGQFVEYDLALQQQVEVTTGFRSQVELRNWTDFYRSPVRYRLGITPGKPTSVLPIGIVSKSIQQAKDGDTLFAHKFVYAYLFRDDFYSADPDEDLAGEASPPPGFVGGGGTVTITQPQLLRAVDDTIPAFIRSLTAGDISKFKLVAARPNPETLGYLTQNAASQLYRDANARISYATDVSDKPTTRDEAGLTDVPTIDEVASLTVTPNLDQVLAKGSVSGAPMKTGGYGRFSFSPNPNPHGLASIIKLGDDAYFIEETDAGDTRNFLSVPRFDLSNVQNGQLFAARRSATGALEMVPVNRDNLQAVGERGSEFRGPLTAEVLQMFAELPGVSYATHLVTTFYNPDIQKWVFVKIPLPKLANDLIGLMPGKALADRILPFLPEISQTQSRTLLFIDDIRCETVTVETPPPADYSVRITPAMLGVAQVHPLGVAGNYINPILNSDDNRDALGYMTLILSASPPYTYTLTADDGSTDFSGKLTLKLIPV